MEPAHPSAATAKRTAGYVPELDTFRAVAILSVLCVHWMPATSLLNRIQVQTSNGVQLFFVLSGFLITGILLQSRLAINAGTTTVHWSLRQFYARRAVRIFPVYYLVLLVGTALAFPGVRAGFWWHATYLSNAYYYRLKDLADGPALVFWSLSVEEQFYLLWPLVILLLPRRAIVPFIAAVAVVGAAWRGHVVRHDPMGYILTPACAGFLAVGALMATVDHPTYGSRRAGRLTRGILLGAIAALLAVELGLLVAHGWTYLVTARTVRAINQTILSLVYGLLFAWAAHGMPRPLSAVLRFPPLTYLGRISYGLYVYHLFVAKELERLAYSHLVTHHVARSTALAWAANGFVRFGATVAVASMSWSVFERPVNNLKRFFPYARPERTPETAVPSEPTQAGV